MYPGLKDNEGHWRHMSRLLFNSNYRQIPIGIYQIGRDYRVLDDIVNNCFSGINYITDFHDEVMQYEVLPYSKYRHYCRHATVNFPRQVLDLVEKELRNYDRKAKRCFIANGMSFNKDTRKQLKEEDLKISQFYLSLSNTPPIILKFMTYLNRLPAIRFSKVLDKIPLAMEALYDTDESGNLIVNPKCHLEQLHILQEMKEQAQPIYRPSLTGNTVRFFQVNRGLQTIHSHLRKILTGHWIELDLQNAHLAIVAKLWDIPELQELLSQGKSIWEVLMPDLGLSLTDAEAKSNLKTLLYSAVYGMSQRQLTLCSEQYFGSNDFLKHPIIAQLMEGKARKLKDLATQEEVKTPMGITHKPHSFTSNGMYNSNHLSIISEEISEYEALLLEPIFDLAMETKQFAITLYQYDGVSIEPADSRRKNSLIKKIKKAVDERAKQLNIKTCITVK